MVLIQKNQEIAKHKQPTFKQNMSHILHSTLMSIQDRNQLSFLIGPHLSPACYTSHLCKEPSHPLFWFHQRASLSTFKESNLPRESSVSGGEWMSRSFLRGLQHSGPSFPTWLMPISSDILCFPSPTGRGYLPCNTRLRLRTSTLSLYSSQKAIEGTHTGFHEVTMPSHQAT